MPTLLLERRPTVAEYVQLIAAVGWKPRDESAIAAAVASSIFSFCAELDGRTVGMGRVIGDGGLHYYVTDLVVHPAQQRQGIGSQILGALTTRLETIPFKNTWVGVFAVEGTAEFYRRSGYKAQHPTGPAMYRWMHPANR